jgi:hypothetical protein
MAASFFAEYASRRGLQDGRATARPEGDQQKHDRGSRAEEREDQEDGGGHHRGRVGLREGAVHAHTQNLGVGSIQLGEILLESFHFTGSTAGEGEDKECQGDILVPPVILQ